MCHKRGLRVSGGDLGPFWCMASIRLAPFYQGGQMLAVHGRKTVCALKFSCVQNEGWGANVGAAELHDRCCPFVRYLGKKSPDNAHQKSRDCTGPVACSGISMPGSFFAKKAVSTTRQSSPNFINANKKKTRERAQNLRTTVFLYWIKYWLKTLVPVQPPPRVGTTTAAYSVTV